MSGGSGEGDNVEQGSLPDWWTTPLASQQAPYDYLRFFVVANERPLDGTFTSTEQGNVNGEFNSGSTATPDPYFCAVSDFEDQLVRYATQRQEQHIQNVIANHADNNWFEGLFMGEFGPEEQAAERARPLSEFMFEDTKFLWLDSVRSHPDRNRLEMIESKYAEMQSAMQEGDTEKFRKLCEEKNQINAETSTTGFIFKREAIAAAYRAAESLAMRGAGGGMRPRPTTTRPNVTGPSIVPRTGGGQPLKPQTQASQQGIHYQNSQRPATQQPTTTGEPVSVTSGEYLETWNDFQIPGTFDFNGARYMGLKLDLPGRYTSPLGPCQISMFDEVISNPIRGKLALHTRDGKKIWFNRPFNFLPSLNASFPGLEVKAPWLKQLTVKEGPVTRYFRQYEDGVYRLEKIGDLNGFELILHRSQEGWLEHAEGADGLSLKFTNDEHGRRLTVTLVGTDDAELELAHYSYDGQGRMLSADCAFGMSVRYAWLSDRDLLDSWHNITGSSRTNFTYDESGRVLRTTTNGIWNGDRFVYDAGETTYLPGGIETCAQYFRYDENENVTEEIDALGGKVVHNYNESGFRTSTQDANGNVIRIKFDRRGNIAEQTDGEGRTTTYIWGDDDELHLVIDGSGNRRHYSHDDRSNVITETDAKGHVTQLERDDMGRIVAIHSPNGSLERREWDALNRLSSVTDAIGAKTSFQYDAFNRIVSTTDPLGQVTRRIYQSGPGGFNIPSSVIRPDGATITRGFDGQGLLSFVTDGEGRRWTYQNGAFGVLESITDPKGGVTSFDYDSEGRILSVTNALGLSYSYDRDAAGRISAEEDFDGRLTRYRRDPAGQLIEAIKPDGARLTYAYDRSGLVRQIDSFDPTGVLEDVNRFWYDGRGLLIRAENKAALVEFQRDHNGLIVSETLNGKRIKSQRDAIGNRVLREMTGNGGGIIQYVRDPLGAIEKMILGEMDITFRRDALGRETQRDIDGFGLTQRYDSAGQLVAQIAGPKRSTDIGVSRLGWNVAAGEGRRKRNGTIARTYEYDRAFAPIRIDDGVWGEDRFTYDDNGQIVSTEGPRGAERFDYDPARNLAGAASAPPFSTENAGFGPQFDAAFGSITPSSRPVAFQRMPSGVVQIAQGPRGEKIQLRHDDCGRLIERRVERAGFRPQRWRYRWDAHDRMIAVTLEDGEEWLFRYDPFGRRVSKVKRFSGEEKQRAGQLYPALINAEGVPQHPRLREEASNSVGRDPGIPVVGTAYMWDGAHMVAEAPLQLDGHVQWETAIHWHFEGGECGEEVASFRLLAKQLGTGEILPVVCDYLGTPKEMFNTRGELVWAAGHHVWGAVRATRVAGSLATLPQHSEPSDELHCPWRFPGQYEDRETGLYYNRFRYYDPLVAQYASPDPIGLAGGDRPQGYVATPTTGLDYLGLQARGPDGKFLPRNGLPGPGSTFASSVTQRYRSQGYQVFENVTVRIDGKVVSFADQIAVKGNQVLMLESKSGRVTLSRGQQAVQEAIAQGKPITVSGPNAPNIPGTITPNQPIVLPNGSYRRVTPQNIGDQ